MKNTILTFFALFTLIASSFGQAPESFKYQAVIRDASNAILVNQNVGMQLTIQQGSIGGTTVYTETFSPTTNGYGLVNLEIGTGTTFDDFSTIDWANGPYFIETAIDLTGGTSYAAMGTSQLVSVPYALYAKSAESVVNDNVDDADADPTNEIQDISLSGLDLSITNGSTVDLSVIDTDTQIDSTGIAAFGFVAGPHTVDTDTDDQTLSLSGSDLTISEGNTIDISSIDTDTQIDSTGIAALGFVAGPHTVDTDTDDQTLSLSGSDLTISEGNTVDISSIDTDTQIDSTGIAALGFVAGPHTVDTDTDDQTLSLSGTNLTISEGNTVNLSSLTDDGDWVVTSGTNYTNGNDGNIGIGDISSSQNRWQLTVKDTVDCMLGTDSVDVSELFTVFTRNRNENNTGVGIGFQSTSTVTGMGAAIVHERTNSNSRGKLHFATKSSGSASDEDLPIRMTLDETGDLGIGVTSPTEKLHIYGGNLLADRGTSEQSLGRSLTLGGARNGDSPFGQIDFQNYDNNNGLSNYVGASIRANNGGDSADKGNLRFLTYNGSLSERMRIEEGGFVGIGETSPQTTLDVVDYAVIGDLSVGAQSTDQGTSIANGLGFTTTPWLYTNAIEAQGERGSASTLITLGADGTYGAADQIHMVTNGTSQMTVASDGKVGFDKTSPNTDLHIRQSQQSISGGTGGIKFEESGDATDYWRIYHSGIYFSFNHMGSRVAYVNTNGAWTVDSDKRLKYDIKALPSVLDRVMKLRPVDYLYNEQERGDKKVIGFVAQEVQPLFPEMVVESEDKLGITYSTTGVIAIKAIQEQQEIIKEQETKIDELQNQLQMLIEEVNKLKKEDK